MHNSFIYYRMITVLIVFLSISACSSYVPPPVPKTTQTQLKQVYQHWKGTPYQYGGTQRDGIDCSAFMQQTFLQAYQIALPRTTHQQIKVGKKLTWKEIKQGDLVFFKIARNSYHVGVYVGSQQFMHASSSRGVIISRLDNPYWAAHFLEFRRVKR